MREDYYNRRIRLLIKDSRLTQAKVAEYVGIPRETLSSMLKGVNNLSLELWIAVADFFDCSLDFLFERSDQQAIAVYDSLGERRMASWGEYSRMPKKQIVASAGNGYAFVTRKGKRVTLGKYRIVRLLE